jgi:type II secretion system protein E
VAERIGQLLVKLGYLSGERLVHAEGVPRAAGVRFGEHLCRLGCIQSDDVLHALAVQRGIGQENPAEIEISHEVLSRVPAEIAQRYRVLPVSVSDSELTLAMADPFDFSAIEDLRAICGLDIARCYARPGELAEAIRRCYGTSAARMADSLATAAKDVEVPESEDSIGHLHELAREPSLINLVNLIIMEAVQDKASDIHIEPFERELRVKYRIDGILHDMSPPPKHLQAAIISRIKIMAQLNIAERFLPQDGHIKFVAAEVHVDIRVSTIPTMYGESVVMRILDKSGTLRRLSDLGMGPAMLETFDGMLRRPHGIVLVTGPTGSGKTTTLYAALKHVYTSAKKIITIEDPVEFHLDGVNQMQVNPKRGLTFANGLRSILRQDPDIVMVGEIRDGETADIAIRSALTGHLVFSSLHTNDAAGAITRLLDMGIEPFLLATTVEGVVAQRLVRVLCARCAEPFEPAGRLLEQLGADASLFRGKVLKQSRGCQECHQTGFRGRVGVFEMIELNDVLRELVMNRPSSSQIRRAVNGEFIDMRRDGYSKVLAGVTTLEEVWRVTQDAQQDNGVAGATAGL